MDKLIHDIAALPKKQMCETLATINIRVVRRFHAYYGIDENDPDSGDLISDEAHAVIGARLSRRRKPKRLRKVVVQQDKISIMAERFEQGREIRNPRDVTIDSLPDDQGILSVWGPGKEPTAVKLVSVRAA